MCDGKQTMTTEKTRWPQLASDERRVEINLTFSFRLLLLEHGSVGAQMIYSFRGIGNSAVAAAAAATEDDDDAGCF